MIKKINLVILLSLSLLSIKAQSFWVCDSVLTNFFAQNVKYKHHRVYIIKDSVIFKDDSYKLYNKRIKKIGNLDDVSKLTLFLFKPYFVKFTGCKEEFYDSSKVYSVNYNVQKYGNSIIWLESGYFNFFVYFNQIEKSITKIELYGGLTPVLLYKKE